MATDLRKEVYDQVIISSYHSQKFRRPMVYFVIKCALSGIIIAVVSEVAKKEPDIRGAHRFATARITPRNFMALARYR